MLAEQSPDEPVLAQFEKAMLLLIERYATAESYDVAALIKRTPSLQARKQANYARSEARRWRPWQRRGVTWRISSCVSR